MENSLSEQVEWISIFNTRAFYELHKPENAVYFEMKDHAGRLKAVTHFSEARSGHFVSPRRGTFGGIDQEGSGLDLMNQFIGEFSSRLREIGAKSAEMVCGPFCHNPAHSARQLNALMSRGWRITNQELNYSLNVDQRPFTERIAYSNVKRIKKCVREGFGIREALSAQDFYLAYETIHENRRSKGHPISMTYEQIEKMRELFPGKLVAFLCEKDGNVPASAICIKVRSDVLYVFYWGDRPGYEQFSPVALIAQGIYEYCQAQSMLVMDAGISTVGGEPNFGLINFKENLGMSASPKLTFGVDL